MIDYENPFHLVLKVEFYNLDFGGTSTEVDLVGVHPNNIYW
jgi:hypothetical protein